MKWPYKIILALMMYAAIFLAGYITAEMSRDPGIEIVEKTTTVTKWIAQPVTDEQCWKCLNNPLELDGAIDKEILHAWATDGCRKSKRDFVLKCSPREYNNIIQAMYMYDIFNQAHGAQVLYFRKFGRFALGGGAYGTGSGGGIIAGAEVFF